MVEARVQIQSSAGPGGHGEGHHRRAGRSVFPSDYKHSFLHNNHKWNRELRESATAPPSKHVKAARAPPAHAPAVSGGAATRKLLQQPAAPALPANWQAFWDEDYKMYYYWNTVTDEVTWDAPSMPSSPAPPPAGGHGGSTDAHGDDHSDAHGDDHSDDHGDDHGDDTHETDAHGGDAHGGSGHGGEGEQHVAGEHEDPIIDLYLFEFGDDAWEHCAHQDIACFRASAVDEELIGRYKIKDEEQALLLEFNLKDDSKDQYMIVISEHEEPMAIAINLHSLGSTGRSQVCVIFSASASASLFVGGSACLYMAAPRVCEAWTRVGAARACFCVCFSLVCFSPQEHLGCGSVTCAVCAIVVWTVCGSTFASKPAGRGMPHA